MGITTHTPEGTTAGKMTATEINNLPRNMNEGFDHFLAKNESDLEKIITEFLKDDSQSDSVHIYIAAGTAFLLENWEAALELFYKAQIRKATEYKIFKWGDADGNNIQTYLGYLNECLTYEINPLSQTYPDEYKTAISRVKKWKALAHPNAYHPENYGEPKISPILQKWAGIKAKTTFRVFITLFPLIIWGLKLTLKKEETT